MHSSTRTWSAVAALYAGLTGLYVWPLVRAFGSRLPGDTGDPGLNSWILWWNAHAIPLTERWWNAPAFFPLRGAFALSETLLGVAPLTSPLQWMGANAVVAYNVAYLFSFIAAALAAHALARHLTGSHGAALLAGVAFGFNPYRAAQVFHIQMLMSFWMPLGLLALHRFLERRQRRDLLLFAVCWLMNGFTTGYFLFFFSVLVACWIAWFVRTWRDAGAIVVTIGLASLPLLPWLVGYARHQASFGLSRGVGEIEFFSADVSAIWATSPFVWLPSHWTIPPRPEGELYPGVVILVLAIIGGFVALRDDDTRPPGHTNHRSPRQRLRLWLMASGTLVAIIALVSSIRGGWQITFAGISLSTNHPFKTVTTAFWLFVAAGVTHPHLVNGWRRRSTLLFYVLAALVMFVFALGPLAHAFGARFLYVAPYAWLMQLPGGHALRVPARFATLVALCLTQAAALTLVRLARGQPRASVLAVLLLAVALDGWVPKLKTEPVPSPVDLAGLDRGAALLELPSSDLYADTGAMLRATRHGHALVNGYSGYQPPHYGFVHTGLQDLDAGVFGALQEFGPLLVFVDRARDEAGRYQQFVAGVPDAALVRDTTAGLVFRLPARLPTPSPKETGADRLLTIRSIVTLGAKGIATSLVDGDPKTSWPVHGGDRTEASARITFDRPVTVSRIEMDLGPGALDYPKRVRVSVPGASPAGEVTIWEDGMAAAAILAALRDPMRIPMTIALSSTRLADQLTITFMAGEPNAAWTIQEMRTYGRQDSGLRLTSIVRSDRNNSGSSPPGSRARRP